jgi:hypothetical protein
MVLMYARYARYADRGSSGRRNNQPKGCLATRKQFRAELEDKDIRRKSSKIDMKNDLWIPWA